MKNGIIIGRPINGISLNGFEYAMDSKGDYIQFGSIEEAKQFLRENGVHDEDDIEDCFVFKHRMNCHTCGREHIFDLSEVSEDCFGVSYYCKECGMTSFVKVK